MQVSSLNRYFEFKIDYHFVLMNVHIESEDMKNQFLIFLEAGNRFERLNGDKLEKESASQFDTVTEIKDWCNIRGIKYGLENKTLWFRIMDFLENRIRQNREVL